MYNKQKKYDYNDRNDKHRIEYNDDSQYHDVNKTYRRDKYKDINGDVNRRNHNQRRQYTYQAEINTNTNIINDIDLDINKNNEISEDEIEKRNLLIEKITSFEDLNISEFIIRGIFAHGFETPSPIQQIAIRPMTAGYDIIAQAQSGLGKTATFCIGALSRIDINVNATQIVIVSHTREMASQILTVMDSLNKYLNARLNLSTPSIPHSQNIKELCGLVINTKVGSWGIRDKIYNDDLTKIENVLIPQIVIGTPGRIIDMIKNNALKVDNLKILVLDEADELLGDGFLEQIRNIISKINITTQITLFSATYNDSIFKLTNNFMNKPIRILVKNEELTLDGIRQYYVNVLNNQYKFETLCDIYSVLTISQTIIFCNNQRTVDYLSQKMRSNNFTVACIHGDMSVVDREQTMKDFRNGVSKVLIATDVIGRGIDVQSVSIVINYELPHKISNYIHRIGRSGRFGRKGCGISFICEDESEITKLKQIQSHYHTEINELPEKLENIFI